MNRKLTRLEARLEIDLRADTVIGTITSDDGVERRFAGWMEFANTIESWREEHRSDAREATTESASRHQAEGRSPPAPEQS